MNKKNLFWSLLTILFASVFSVSLVSCGDDDDDNSNESTITENDPEGTIIANLTNTFYETGNWYYDNGIMISDGYLGMNNSNNLQAEGYGNSYNAEIVSVGKVNGLSSIKNIPETGWSHQTAAIPGYGYVYRQKYASFGGQYYFARIYAVDYMKSTSGGIMGITIKYQENWEPDAK